MEFDSEPARLQAVESLRLALAEAGLPLHEISLPTGRRPSQLVRELIGQLSAISDGVVSITGFASAFSDPNSLQDALQVLNFNRELLAQPALRQIWWMPTGFAEAFIRAVQDLDSWFLVRLHLKESRGVWGVPHPRSEFFTGREDILQEIGGALASTGAVALTGLGGIGKTQVAVEYIYLHRNEYSALLWVRAASREELVADLVTTARLLALPEKDENDDTAMVRAAQQWLQDHPDWLLVLDNCEDPALVREFIPPGATGRLLLTRRASAPWNMGEATRRFALVEMTDMKPAEGALLLLRRAKMIAAGAALESASSADRAAAEAVSRELGGLPLALEQAGAYIEETSCSAEAYLDLYRKQANRILLEQGAVRSVVATFAESFAKIEQANPASAELLRLCAFLSPDAIPEEILTEGAFELGPILKPAALDPNELNKAIAETQRYSLLRRDPNSRTLAIHPLVQAVIRNGMGEAKESEWAERVVRAVNEAFPEVELSQWDKCERLILHAQECARLIEKWRLEFEAAGRLLNDAGGYLYERARFAEAEALFKQALAIRETALEPEHPDVARSLNNLGAVYSEQGRYSEAESLYQRALAIREKVLGREHPDVATTLNDWGVLSRRQGKYGEAEQLLLRALCIRQRTLGPDDPHVATSLNNLASLYQDQGRYDKAEPLYERAVAIWEKTDHPNLPASLNNLAELYREQGKYSEAEPLYRRALAILEKTLGPEHPKVATVLENLAILLRKSD